MSTFLNISTDTTLGGNSPSDSAVSSQKAIKTYVDAHSGGGSTYTAGDGIDITNNVISVDGVQTSEVELATVATSGSYNDLSNKPTIPTVNNATLTITQGGVSKGTFTANASSNVTIDLDSGGSVDVDNSTITLNSSDQIQTVAVKDNRSGNAIKTWTGTKAQYDAILSKDSNTLYNITDDTDVTLSLLNLLYPVGSIYIGTMNACPLATLGVGTWQIVGTAIVTSVSSSVSVKGNGMTLGLTNGSDNYGLSYYATIGAQYYKPTYGENVGNTNQQTPPSIAGSLGVTTDSTKSGIVGTATSTSLTVNIFERTA